MKNIHVLPTTQPSNLLLCIKSYTEHKDTPAENSDNKGNFRLGLGVYANKMFYQPQHIYITSDEEIKEGDWILKCSNINDWNFKSGELQEKDYSYFKVKCVSLALLNYEDKKIILTTDQDLIKDGVQAIDDDFLEWFVKNPTCENVEVSYGVLKPFQSIDKGYMIHLPDNEILEEPKQETNKTHYLHELFNMDKDAVLKIWNASIPKLEPKQETLEPIAYNVGDNIRIINPSENQPKLFTTHKVDNFLGVVYYYQSDGKEESIGFSYIKKEKPKQETTLEEVDENKKNLYYYKQIMNPYPVEEYSHTAYEKGFVDGYEKASKLQQEQDKKMYSEEDLRETFESNYDSQNYGNSNLEDDFKEWLEKFKKK